MSKREQQLEQWLEDAVAFLNWAYRHGEDNMIRSTLIHDIVSLLRRDTCFVPRVDGYAILDAKERSDETA